MRKSAAQGHDSEAAGWRVAIRLVPFHSKMNRPFASALLIPRRGIDLTDPQVLTMLDDLQNVLFLT